MDIYWYQLTQEEHQPNSWNVGIKSNNDLLKILWNHKSKEEAKLAAESFIDGIKFVKGE